MAARSWSGLTHPFLRPAGRPGLSPVLGDRLLVGEYPTPDDVEWLRDAHGVQAVVSLQDDVDLAYKGIDWGSLADAYRRAGVSLRRFGVADGEPEGLLHALDEILPALHALLQEGRRVYLHCNAGYNRAPTVAIAYLVAYAGRTIDEAYGAVRARRACAPYLGILRRYFSGRR